MKPSRPWQSPYRHTWHQVFRDMAALLVDFLAPAYFLDCLKGLIP